MGQPVKSAIGELNNQTVYADPALAGQALAGQAQITSPLDNQKTSTAFQRL